MINELLVRLPKLSPIKARITLQDAYETRFGIFDHFSAHDRPLASVEMFECENFTEQSVFYDAYLEFAEKNYREIWGLNVQEFLGQPQYIVKMMREITTKIMEKKASMLKDLEDATKGGVSQ